MKLIDKDALVAEIERRKSQFMSHADSFHKLGMEETRDYYVALASNLNSVLSFIKTLEVKDVDLEKEYERYYEQERYVQTFKLAKHFFELGLKAQKGE